MRTLGDTRGIISIGMSPDGVYLVSGSSTGSISVWTLEDESSTRNIWHSQPVTTVAVSSDGYCASTTTSNPSIYLCEVSTGLRHHVLSGHLEKITSLTFSQSGEQILSGSYDRTIRVWDTFTGTALSILSEQLTSVTSLSFFNDEEHVLFASMDGAIKVQGLNDAGHTRILEGHTNSIYHARPSLDMKQITSISLDGTTRFWNVDSGSCLRVLTNPPGMTNATLSPDTRQLAFVTQDAEIYVQELPTWDPPRLTHVEFCPDGKLLKALTDEGEMKEWNLESNDTAPSDSTEYSYCINGEGGHLFEEWDENARSICRVPSAFLPLGYHLIFHGRRVVIWHENGTLLYLNCTSIPISSSLDIADRL